LHKRGESYGGIQSTTCETQYFFFLFLYDKEKYAHLYERIKGWMHKRDYIHPEQAIDQINNNKSSRAKVPLIPKIKSIDKVIL